MDDILSPVCTQVTHAVFSQQLTLLCADDKQYFILHMQVYTDVTIDHVVPPVLAKGDTGPASPNGTYFILLFISSLCTYFKLVAGTHDIAAAATTTIVATHGGQLLT